MHRFPEIIRTAPASTRTSIGKPTLLESPHCTVLRPILLYTREPAHRGAATEQQQQAEREGAHRWGRPDAASRLRITCRMRSMCFSSALMLLPPPPAPPAELELWGPSVPAVPTRGMLPRDADIEERALVLPRGVRFELPPLAVLWSELRLFADILACMIRGPVPKLASLLTPPPTRVRPHSNGSTAGERHQRTAVGRRMVDTRQGNRSRHNATETDRERGTCTGTRPTRGRPMTNAAE